MTHALSYAQTLMTHTLRATRKVCTFAALSCILASSALASTPSEEKPAAAAMPTHKVAQSASIDRVIQTVYANSPLNAAVLRKVLADANPKVITGNPQQRVKAGTTIMVPDHGHVVKNILMPHVAAVPEPQEPGPSASESSARRQWVRFP
jgi:hypothetical protein